MADDGSGTETSRVTKEILGHYGRKWRHVRHEDRGVRPSRIKNLAAKYSSSEYLLFVDHDVVLHPEFVADHILMAGKGVFLQGKRVLLPSDYTAQVLTRTEFVPPSFWVRGLGNRKNTIRFTLLAKILARPKKFETSLRGCNLSMYRSDFLRVDGFDETFDGIWGREDSDICYRLFHSGIRVKNLWFAALQYHLRHEVIKNWEKDRLDSEIEKNIDEKRTKSLRGFSTLSSEGDIVASGGA